MRRYKNLFKIQNEKIPNEKIQYEKIQYEKIQYEKIQDENIKNEKTIYSSKPGEFIESDLPWKT